MCVHDAHWPTLLHHFHVAVAVHSVLTTDFTPFPFTLSRPLWPRSACQGIRCTGNILIDTFCAFPQADYNLLACFRINWPGTRCLLPSHGIFGVFWYADLRMQRAYVNHRLVFRFLPLRLHISCSLAASVFLIPPECS